MNQSRINCYWDGGAFCVNCGILQGNVYDDGVHPIWHPNCKTGCMSSWNSQDTESLEKERPLNAAQIYALLHDDVNSHAKLQEVRGSDEDYHHPYEEDDPELELEAREEYKREMEAQEREEEEMAERDRQESSYGYYNGEDYDSDDDASVDY